MPGTVRRYWVVPATCVAVALVATALWLHSDAGLQWRVRTAAGRGDWPRLQRLALEWERRGSGGLVAPWLVWRSAHRLRDVRFMWPARARVECTLRPARAPLWHWARALTDRYPHSPAAWQLRADAGCQVGQLTDGLAAAGHALQLAPRDPYSYLARAWIREYSGQRSEAIADARRAIEVDPRCAPAYVDLGWLHNNAGDYSAGERECREAMDINPLCTTAHVGIGEALTGLGRCREAVGLLNQAIALGAHNPHVLKRLSAAHEALGEHDLARKDLEQAISLAPWSPYVMLWLAGYDLARADYTRALQTIDKARKLAPGDATFSYWRALALEGAGRRREADKEWQRYLSISLDRATAYLDRGSARCDQGQYALAIADFTASLRAHETAPSYTARSWAYRRLGKGPQALNDAEAAVRLGGGATAYQARAHAYHAVGDDARALSDMERARTLAPGDPTLAEDAFWFFVALGKRDEATEAARTFMAAMPKTDARARSMQQALGSDAGRWGEGRVGVGGGAVGRGPVSRQG